MAYLNQIDKIYSQTLLKLAVDNGQVLDEITQIEEVFAKSKELTHLIQNPAINTKHKTEILDEIFKDKINSEIYKFLIVLVEKNRINRLKQIVESFKINYYEENNIKNVIIISAIELNEEMKKNITAKLENKLNKKVMPQWETDKDIIAGLIFKLGDTVIDTSLRHKLENLNKLMK